MIKFTIGSLFLTSCFTLATSAIAVEGVKTAKPKEETPQAKATQGKETFSVGISEEVRAAIMPLIDSIRDADVSRATVEMLTDSVMAGQVVESQRATFQIAAKKPGKFTVYLKEPKQRTRIYCDGKNFLAAMAPDAYFRLPKPISTQEAVTGLSIPLGPYPEPVLALSMAGCDPSISFIAGMKSISLVDRKPFRSKIPAVHLRGIQADAVKWDLWIASDKEKPQPLRLLIDMTPMLAASDKVHVPKGFSYQIRYDFLTWRVSGKVEDNLFAFKPAKAATQYKSLNDYFKKITTGSVESHPLLGKPAPLFRTQTVGGKKFELASLKGQVVVIDFWASWCKPCHAAMPSIKKVTDQFAKKGVVLLAINTEEEVKAVQAFLKDSGMKLNVLMDGKGNIANGYLVDSLPMTVLIGKDGLVESVHQGFPGKEALQERLKDELEVLTIGGRIGSADSHKKGTKAVSPKSPSNPAKKKPAKTKPPK